MRVVGDRLHGAPNLVADAGAGLRRASQAHVARTDAFDDPNLPGEMRTTIALHAVPCGTELSIVQEGLPEAIPVEMC